MTSERAPDPTHPDASESLVSENYSGDGLPTCGAKTRGGDPCRNYAMKNGRCRMHGGASTGPKTAAGVARWRAAVTTHGGRSREMKEFRARVRDLRAGARKLVEMT